MRFAEHIRRALPPVTSAALLLGLLTACGTDAASTPDTGQSVERPTTDPVSDGDETTLVVDITWARTSESDKDSICAGISAFGTRWAADQMRQGAGTDSVDWDRAAVLVQQKCAQR
jgi:hypothetical protein